MPLNFFQDGRANENLVCDYENAIMANQVKDFKPAELKALAKYLASLPSEMKTVPPSPLR